MALIRVLVIDFDSCPLKLMELKIKHFFALIVQVYIKLIPNKNKQFYV